MFRLNQLQLYDVLLKRGEDNLFDTERKVHFIMYKFLLNVALVHCSIGSLLPNTICASVETSDFQPG